jgi:ribosomal protein L37AE/L43A
MLARRAGQFAPRCCNRDMAPLERRLAFYVCPICGAEVAVLRGGTGGFAPRCCNREMAGEVA